MVGIRPWLYVGRYSDLLNPGYLQAHAVGAVLQLAESGVDLAPLPTLHLPVHDGEPLPDGTLEEGVTFLRAHKAQGRIVLVTCGVGISRSSTFAIAALKEEESLGLIDALREVCAKHTDAMPNPVMWESLCKHYGTPIPLREMFIQMANVRRQNRA